MANRVWMADLYARGVVGALAVAFAAGLSACSDAGDTPPSSSSPSAAIDPCALVTRDEATQALGAQAGPGERPSEANFPPRMTTCRYTAPRGQGLAVMTVLVQQSDTPDQARSGFGSAKAQFPAATATPGLGDDAFAMANQLNVLHGRFYFNITGDFDLETAKTLAETALQRLP